MHPQTLGEHLRKRRHEFELFQKDVAVRLEVNQWTYLTWEKDKAQPVIGMWPRIIKYLGYYPFPATETLADQLLAKRRHLGLSRKRLAQRLGIDEGTLFRTEGGKAFPSGNCGARIKEFLATIPAPL